jgi:hypothetical protein
MSLRATSTAIRARLIRRAVLGVIALFICGLGATAWYAYDKGFTKKWRGLIQEEFRKQGFEVTLRRLTIDPFRGLVAKEVKVFETKNRRRTLAVIDEMTLGINYANAIRGRAFLDTLDLRDANLSLPLDPANPRRDRLEITKLNARLFLPHNQIYLARAEAEVAGIRVFATGRLLNPQAFRIDRDKRKEGRTAEMAANVLDELRKLKIHDEPPLLAVEFRGDLSDPGGIAIDLRLEGQAIRRDDYEIHDVRLAATVRNGVVELQRCDIRDDSGLFQAHAVFRTGTRELEARLRSDLDIQSMAQAFDAGDLLRDWTFRGAPSISLQGRAKFDGEAPSYECRGSVKLKKFAYKTVIFEGLSVDGSWDGTRWSMRDLKLLHRSGEVSGDFLHVPGDFRARIHSTVNPKLIAPLLSGRAAQWFERFNFKDAPGFDVDVQGSEPELAASSTDPTGRVAGAR